jgi:hypothetical protein
MFLEQADGPIDGRNADFRIDPHGPPVDHFNVGMVMGFAKHPRDDPPLPGHFQTFFDAQILNSVRHCTAPPVVA